MFAQHRPARYLAFAVLVAAQHANESAGAAASPARERALEDTGWGFARVDTGWGVTVP
ncbi:hypothetical protein LUW75_23280 [Streptomyces sp. MRC013]|uniref:hypothetical protein n=1 Tax=Streptomyces sp. MRC013 TaxID=2898276 RepID=UPI002026886C|nr:hypothetical protein [Streptomyces sp. MRC013]URM92394.1 hypothetical protein LUW75_23280 [Streptomyces sp. MRC013]